MNFMDLCIVIFIVYVVIFFYISAFGSNMNNGNDVSIRSSIEMSLEIVGEGFSLAFIFAVFIKFIVWIFG